MNHKRFGKDFTLVVVGQIVSLFGNAILRFSLPLYLLRKTGSPTLFGVVTACSILPMAILSLLGGVLADRVNKRNIMVCLDFSTAMIVAAFYLLIDSVPPIPLFIVTLMLLYGISGIYQPAVLASVPALVSKESILSASAVVNQIGALASFIGPIIGGVLYGIYGIGAILKVSIVCFVLSAMMELFIHIPFCRQPTQDNIICVVQNDLQDSWNFLKYQRPIFIQVCVVIAGLNLFLSAMLMVGIPVIIVKTLSMSDQMLGITQGLLAAGGILGGLLTVLLSKKLHPQKSSLFLYLCAGFTCVMGLGMLPSSANLNYAILSATSFAITIFSTMFSIQMLAVVQTQTPQHLVGKVVASIMTLVICAQPMGQLLYGILFGWIQSVSIIIIGAGIISLLIALYGAGVLAKLERNEING